MKQKITFCCLLLLFASGCFSIAEAFLGSEVKAEKIVASSTVATTVVTYQYQFPPVWWYRWWYDTGGRCWWLDYNYHPKDWPRPRIVTPRPRIVTQRRNMIPRGSKAGIDCYVDNGVPTGSFLYAVLSNDLFEAIARADDENQLALATICRYIDNYTPSTCHGSPEKVRDWFKFHRATPTQANRAASADRERREHYYEMEAAR